MKESRILICLPEGICSWNYRVLNASNEARLEFERLTEQGAIQFGGKHYDVVKHGWASGRWTLEQNATPIAEALKRSAFSRTIEVSADGRTLTAQAQLLSRQVSLEIDGRPVGAIAPAHLFTRRATIDCAAEVPELVQLFVFWLVALLWRRAAKNSSSSGST